YLRADPKAPNCVEVEGHIGKLSSLIQQEKRASSAPPTLPLVVRGPAGTTPEAQPSPPPQVAVAPSPPPAVMNNHAVVVQKEPENQPITKKKWFWPVI